MKIKAILMDVDGVLTDGGIVYCSAGIELKSFDVKDGYGISLAQQQGMILGIITGRASEIVLRRAHELGITEIYQGAIDKRSSYEEFKQSHSLKDEEIAYMGDDMLDLPVLQSVGFAAAPQNAHPAVKMAVHYITKAEGGKGAVREMIDMILSVQEKS